MFFPEKCPSKPGPPSKLPTPLVVTYGRGKTSRHCNQLAVLMFSCKFQEPFDIVYS